MIEKFISIANIGHFVNYKFQNKDGWDGLLKKVSVIYAENGSGKTTLATILKSLSSNDSLLMSFKKTFDSSQPSKMELLYNNKKIEFNGDNWNEKLNIEVFDINYIEDYLFVGSVSNKHNKLNLFKLLFGNKGVELKKKIKTFTKTKTILLKKLKTAHNKTSSRTQIKELDNQFIDLKNDFETLARPIFKQHITRINKYLKIFCTYIKIKDFKYDLGSTGYELYNIIPVYEIYGKKIEFLWPTEANKYSNARYSLSEGDKSTIALCFFLARLSLNKKKNKIIVFDDPLSSFDNARRSATVTELSSLTNDCDQLILLSHDIYFANEFSKKCRKFTDVVNLKIQKRKTTSGLYLHDISSELLSDFQKDIITVRRYIDNDIVDANESVKRDVVKCIRNILEGVIKTKYFDVIRHDMWLGAIIEKITENRNDPKFSKLVSVKKYLVMLNDYSQTYYHSEPEYSHEPINDMELRNNLKLLMETYYKI